MNAILHRLPAVLAVAVAWTLAAATSGRAQGGAGAPPPLARAFRGAWVATVDNIDFPSRPGLAAPQLRAELDAIVARAVELREQGLTLAAVVEAMTAEGFTARNGAALSIATVHRITKRAAVAA
jgi:hypothetical protein